MQMPIKVIYRISIMATIGFTIDYLWAALLIDNLLSVFIG